MVSSLIIEQKLLSIDICRQNTSDSLPRRMPMVVDESVEVCVRELDGDTEHKGQRLDTFRPLTWSNTLHPVSFGGLYCV